MEKSIVFRQLCFWRRTAIRTTHILDGWSTRKQWSDRIRNDKSPYVYRRSILPGSRRISNDAGHCKSFFFALSLCSSTLVRRRTNRVRIPSVHLCHPNLLSPFSFINSVLPTNHLFGHHQP